MDQSASLSGSLAVTAAEEQLRRHADLLAGVSDVLASSLDVDTTVQRAVEAAVPWLGDWCACTLVDGDEVRMFALAHAEGTEESHATALRQRWPQRVDDATPVPTAIRTGEAVLIDVGEPELEAAARDNQHLRDLRAMGIRTALIAPLVVPTGVLGALVLLRTVGEPHDPADLQTAQALADRAAVAIGHARAHAEATTRLALLDTFFESAPVGLAFLDADLRYRRVNGLLAAMNATPAAEHVGRTPIEVLGPAAEEVTGTLRGILASGETVTREFTVEDPVRGGEGHFLSSVAPVDAGDERIGVTAVVVDITPLKAAEERERLLGRVGETMDAEREPAAAARRLCDALVAKVGDGCLVLCKDGDGTISPLAARHRDPARQEPLDRLLHLRPPRTERPRAGQRALRTMQAVLLPHIGPELRAAFAGDAEEAALFEELDFRSVVVAPLVARGRAIGVLAVLRDAASPPFDEDDRRFLGDVGRRAGLTLDNLALYAGQKLIASTLQSRLLPRRIPDIDGLEVATRYRAAGEHNDVGGDFYDVFPGVGGRWTALVGDVAGKGPEAAALTASIRQIVRTGSRWCDDAVELLGVVNSELEADADARTCTLAHAALREAPDGLHVAITLAGHPQPLLLRADGTVEAVGVHGTLLGGLVAVELETEEVVLGPGDLLLLFTDGAVEVGRGRKGGELLDLAPVLAGCAGDQAADVVRCVEAAAVEAAGGTAPDDIALVCLRRRP